MSNEIKYKNNFLNTVICRIDFLDNLSDEIINKVIMLTDLTNDFPIKDKDQLKEDASVAVFGKFGEKPVVSNKQEQYIEKTLIDNYGKNRFVISKKAIIFEYTQYTSFAETKKQLSYVINTILNNNNSVRINRFGLRYINVFDCDTRKINKNFFSENLKGLVKFEDFKQLKVSRALGNVEFLEGDMRLTMKYGNFNRQYPGIIEKYDFVLDYDAVVTGVNLLSDIYNLKLELAHDMIQAAFEGSITDNLRDIMRG